MTGSLASRRDGEARVLVAGIGNVFLGDDGFGVEVIDELRRRELPDGVEVADYGIRGFDLASALLDTDVAILVDAIPRDGKRPGEVFLLEPTLPDAGGAADPVNGHGLNPLEVFRLVQRFGGPMPKTYLVGCCPAPLDETQEEAIGLSPAVRSAVPAACRLVGELLSRLVPQKEV